MFIVVSGNPMDGLNFYGPFETYKQADAWALLAFKMVEFKEPQQWLITELQDVFSVKSEYPLILKCPDCGPVTKFFPPVGQLKYTQHCEGCGRAIHIGSTPPGKDTLFG
jgi:hypothetical protein